MFMARKNSRQGSFPPSPSGMRAAFAGLEVALSCTWHMSQSRSSRIVAGGGRRGGGRSFGEPCEQAASELLAELRLRDSKAPRLHDPTSLPPASTHINYLSPVLRLLLFFLLQLQTGCLPSKPRLAVLRAQFQLFSTTFLNTIFLTAWNSSSGLLATTIVGLAFPHQGHQGSSELLGTPPSPEPEPSPRPRLWRFPDFRRFPDLPSSHLFQVVESQITEFPVTPSPLSTIFFFTVWYLSLAYGPPNARSAGRRTFDLGGRERRTFVFVGTPHLRFGSRCTAYLGLLALFACPAL